MRRYTRAGFVGLVVLAAASSACEKKAVESSSPTVAPPEPAPVASTAAPGRVNPRDVSGNYKILSAANPGGGGGYSGTVAITKQGDHYQLVWTIGDDPPYRGVGLVMGQVFGVGWGLGDAYGVAIYKVSGGSLDGRWATSRSQGRAGTEKLSGPAGLNGTYQITEGKDGDALQPYTGTVTIKPSGKVYQVTWTLPSESYSGVGILDGEIFSVGWGSAGKGAGAVMYEVGETLDGKWAQPDGTALGSEVLGKL
ncbi:MAG: hypothetical protein OZ921_05170 [Sorangiineae bacterium]|nr:hypothetical protein [Polyangiaceae bacterium]MEB2321883.1 hypothetical protein [Sorangiineae bacterium]